jgi:hypothetical protein
MGQLNGKGNTSIRFSTHGYATSESLTVVSGHFRQVRQPLFSNTLPLQAKSRPIQVSYVLLRQSHGLCRQSDNLVRHSQGLHRQLIEWLQTTLRQSYRHLGNPAALLGILFAISGIYVYLSRSCTSMFTLYSYAFAQCSP